MFSLAVIVCALAVLCACSDVPSGTLTRDDFNFYENGWVIANPDATQNSATFLTDDATTYRGCAVGSTRDEVKTAYRGCGDEFEGDVVTLKDDDGYSLSFFFEDDVLLTVATRSEAPVNKYVENILADDDNLIEGMDGG